jgi:Deacetylase PdaC
MRGTVFIALGALAATACNAGPPAQSNEANAASPELDAAPTAPEGKPVVLKSETPLLTWEASWPAEVNAIPALEKLIREPAEKALADYTRDAREQKAQREKDGFDFNGYMYSLVVEVAGQTPRLLSLMRNWMEYAGGAHPNRFSEALLWDKDANALVPLTKLLRSASLESLYRDAFCKALDKQRAEKREGVDVELDAFTECPKFDEIRIIPKGPVKGGPMTTLLFHADPYVAGPYVEGEYDIELPVSAALVAALKPEFRASFAAPR